VGRKIVWSERARMEVRRLDRDTAMRIFTALQRFAETGEGDVKKLKGQPGELRLRVGTIEFDSATNLAKSSAFIPSSTAKRPTANVRFPDRE
jgi:hypothetical protein